MKIIKDLEKGLSEYRLVVGLVVIILLATLCIMTYINFEKQNEIIETGGFIDGKIKCVCNQDTWDQFQSEEAFNLSFGINSDG